MIRILIVDDSETEISILKSIIMPEPDFEIIGYAKNGKEAVELVALLKPDLITMDIHMPVMDGYEATRAIMSQTPTPIVVISSRLNDESLKASFRALEAGAISVLEKPGNISAPSFKQQKQRIIDTLRSMAEIKVIKRRFHIKHTPKLISDPPSIISNKFEIVAIGASVGGPQALKIVLSKLPGDFPLPIVIVQHITPGFISGFAKWLNNSTQLEVKIAKSDEILKGGRVYFAGDKHHMEVVRSHNDLSVQTIKGHPISGFCPSITTLFQSVAKTCGKNSIGILLTGMGSDGASGLLALKHAGAHTLIQDEQSTVVFGMAGVAQTLGAVDKVIDLDQMSDYLIKVTS